MGAVAEAENSQAHAGHSLEVSINLHMTPRMKHDGHSNV